MNVQKKEGKKKALHFAGPFRVILSINILPRDLSATLRELTREG